MSTPRPFHGFRGELIDAIDASDRLLNRLLDKDVLTQDQYDQIRVRRFTVVYY